MTRRSKVPPSEISRMYDEGMYRLNQERLDFLLPQVRDFVKDRNWLNLRPEYQRRLVWDRTKKSRFIESLLMNVPTPPVFLYEFDLNRYEVMDGQQRLNAVLEFYENKFPLRGLDVWHVLNGHTYSECPPRIRSGLDRRRISATVLLAESADDEEQRDLIRRQVFERLNTGGQPLNPQELRNAMFSGRFNALLIELAGVRLFNEIWGVPAYDEHYDIESGEISDELSDNALFKRMRDCEIVLRFFAFRRLSKIRGSVRRILDTCMQEYRDIDVSIQDDFRCRFVDSLSTARRIFGSRTFQIKSGNRWRHSIPVFDAIMVSLDHRVDVHEDLIAERESISTNVHAAIEDPNLYELMVGKPNTAHAIKDRIEAVGRLIDECL